MSINEPNSVAEIYQEYSKANAKLTDWKKEPKLSELKAELKEAEVQTSAQVAKVQDWIDAYTVSGKYAPPDIKGRSKVSARLVRKQIEWRSPTLSEPFLNNAKLFEVSPRTYEDTASAKQHELILNYQAKNKINLVGLVDGIVRTAAIEGTAIVKTYWDRRTDKYKETEYQYQPVEITDPQQIQQLQQNAQASIDNPNMLNTMSEGDRLSIQVFLHQGAMVNFVPTAGKEVLKERVRNNHPNAEVCNLDDIFVDTSCNGNFEKAKFLIHRFETSLADLQADGRYVNLDMVKKDLDKSNNTYSSARITNKQFTDSLRKTIEVYEYWGYYDTDDTGNLYSIVAAWVGNVMIRMENNPYPDNRIPFVFIPMIPVKNSIYGEPDVELLKDNQRVLSAIQRGIIDTAARSSNGQVGFAQGFLDRANKRKFDAGENYEYNMGSPQESIYVHKFQEVSSGAMNLMQIINSDSESLTGVRPFAQSTTGDAVGKTENGTRRNSMDATAKRDASILRRISQGMVSIGYKWQTMNSMFLTDEDVIRITNGNQHTFVPVDENNLSGDLDLSIDVNTPEAAQEQIQNLVMLMQTGQQMFPLDFCQKVLAQIAKAQNLPDLENYFLNYQPQPDPLQQQKTQLEIAKLQAEIAKLNADAAEQQAKAQVHQAEVEVRNQRASNIQSNTDSKNIDTYKKANGIEQAEKLEQDAAKHQNELEKININHLNIMDKGRQDHKANLLQQGANAQLSNTIVGDPNVNV